MKAEEEGYRERRTERRTTARDPAMSRTLPVVIEAAPRDFGCVGHVVSVELHTPLPVTVDVSLDGNSDVMAVMPVGLPVCASVSLSVTDNTMRTSRQCRAIFQPSMF